MKSITNLSGNPFRNRRLFWLAMLAIFVVATYAGLSAIESRTSAEREITGYTSEIRMLETQLKKLEKPVRTTQAISLDENRELVAASDLIARRAFSWTQLLNDIERNLPPTVRVLRVAVSQITAEERDEMVGGGRLGAAELTLDVIGKTSLDVTSMINRFHESNRFKVSPVSKKSVEGTEEVEFSLKVEYFPPSSRPEPGSQVASAEVKR
ncbi:MAG: hypothetical protein AB7H86_12380 [Blastocatellales bacterium]